MLSKYFHSLIFTVADKGAHRVLALRRSTKTRDRLQACSSSTLALTITSLSRTPTLSSPTTMLRGASRLTSTLRLRTSTSLCPSSSRARVEEAQGNPWELSLWAIST